MSNQPLPARMLSPDLERTLRGIYEEMMWLAEREEFGVTAPMARYWAVHRIGKFPQELRVFTGYVSKAALDSGNDLVLEHHERFDKQISDLVRKHLAENLRDPAAFLAMAGELDSVNIVTDAENKALPSFKGDYAKAGIELVAWNLIKPARQAKIFERKLKRLSNSHLFRPGSNLWPPSADDPTVR